MATATFPVSACLPVNLTGQNNPGDAHIPIGRWDPGTGLSWATRALLKASISFAGMTAINEARLYFYIHTAAGWHANGTGTKAFWPFRKSADWSEGSGGDTTGTDETWGGSGASLVTANYVDDAAGTTQLNTDAADGTLVYISITPIVRAWLAGSPNYGVMVRSASGSESTDATDAIEFYSRRTAGKVPYFWIDYTANTAPTAPTGLTPTGDQVTHTGRTITLGLTRADPDAGDYISGYQVELATDAGVTLADSGDVSVPGGPTTVSPQVTIPGPANPIGDPYYKWRGRTRDKAAAWGPYSAYQRFRPNSVPSTPAAPTVEVDTLTPTIGGSFADPDAAGSTGATLAAVQVVVELGVAPYTALWDSGEVAKSAAPWSIVYAGAPLAWGTAYVARYRVRDALGGLSAWGSDATWSTTQPVGPDNLTPRTTTAKQNSLTPTLTVGHSALFRNDEYEVYAANDLASTRLQAKTWAGADYANTLTKGYTYAGTALAWGTVYYWRARVELADGTVTAWSGLVPFRTNALPTTPALSVTNADASAPVISSGVSIVTSARPILVCPFTDPDVATDGDTPSARRIEVRRKDTQAALSGYPVTTGTTTTHALTSDLTAEVVYEARWGYRDAAGQPAASYVYSAWLEIRRSTTPAIALTAPAAGGSVTDSTPLLDWAFTPAGSKVQATYRAQVFDLGPIGALYPGGEIPAHDSGVRAGTATAYEVPPGVIVNGHRYRWQVTATDSDGLVAVLT